MGKDIFTLINNPLHFIGDNHSPLKNAKVKYCRPPIIVRAGPSHRAHYGSANALSLTSYEKFGGPLQWLIKKICHSS